MNSWKWDEGKVMEYIVKKLYLNRVGVVNELPRSSEVRRELDAKLRICSDRSARLVLVEQVDDYKVFIAIPNGKSECDFRVWRYSGELSPQLKIPTHDDLGQAFIQLKQRHELVNEYLINSIIKLLKELWSVDRIVKHYFSDLGAELRGEIMRFLHTLKWIRLQEDVNYPPPKYMGSKMTLAVYALLESGFNLSEIRRVIRFR